MKGNSSARAGGATYELVDLKIMDHSESVRIFGREEPSKERGVDMTLELGIRDIDKIVRCHARRDIKHVKRLQALLAQIEYGLYDQEAVQ
jgi:hypothetical protein